MSLIGQPLTRREDPPLLTGRGQYVDDVAPPGTLHAFVVRSPVAHAALTGIDVTEARAAPTASRPSSPPPTWRRRASARCPAPRACRRAG